MQRQLPQIVTTFNEDVEGAKLRFLVVLAGMQCVEIRMPSTTEAVLIRQ
jgi:hypothetical protein